MAKTKSKTQQISDRVIRVAGQAGLVLMTAAITLSTIELTEHNGRAVVPAQAALSPAPVAEHEHSGGSPIRREREETGSHFVSYSNYQRTPARSGRA